jgi:hypothetical protein
MTNRVGQHVDSESGLNPVYAYPLPTSSTYSLANWTTHRVLFTELDSPDECLYQGTLDDAKGTLWAVFIGASQPANWGQRVAIIDLSNAPFAADVTDVFLLPTNDQIAVRIRGAVTGSTAGFTLSGSTLLLANSWTSLPAPGGDTFIILTLNRNVLPGETVRISYNLFNQDGDLNVNGQPIQMTAQTLVRTDTGSFTPAIVDAINSQLLTAERLAKIDLIGTGSAIVQTPVSTTGQITTLVIGDDYLVSLGTQITFHVTTTSTPTACTLAFVSACGTSTLSVSGTVTEVESGVFDLVFEITRAQNADLVAGVYNYSVEMRDAGGNKITVAHSDLSRSRRMNWVNRYT